MNTPFPLARPAFPEASREDVRACDPTWIAGIAVDAMIAEARLTPKPGLVDGRGSGCHADLSLDLMERSARSLRPCFQGMARAATVGHPGPGLRETLAAIGREGEQAMYAATEGVNTHKGAIFALGLLVAGAVMATDPADAAQVARLAAAIAAHRDGNAPDPGQTNGGRAMRRYHVVGALGEAQAGFPHVVDAALPALRMSRRRGADEDCARLDALMAIMADLDDTCLLHRGGTAALDAAKTGAQEVLARGGTANAAGRAALDRLDRTLRNRNVSPGGSGDLLAATLFLDVLATPSSTPPRVDIDQHGEPQPWNY
jgi:triphosphoribosyl-dephospho-CoA synthase